VKKGLIYAVGSAVTVVVVAVIVVVGIIIFKPEPNPAILKNEIILKKGPGSYMQARHIVLKGTNQEIGKALAEIAKSDYRARLVKYASPLYGKARLAYMKTNYPILLERMKGVASAFRLAAGAPDYDTSSLYYCLSAPKCSAIFFPARVSENGRNFYACNRDYYLGSMSEVMGEKRRRGEEDMLSRMVILEMYPDKGYPSIGIGALDLMNMRIDCVNSKGLSVAALEDDTFGMDHVLKDLSRQSGLHQYQAIQLIMDTCSTLEEAKEAILNNKITMSLIPAHFIVMDSSGRSFIYERSSKDPGERFIDGEGKPVIITNHSVYDYPEVDKFPEPAKDDYDSFNRYRRLEEYVRAHKGKFSERDGAEAMALAFGKVDEASEGGHHDIPLRTLYTALVDIDNRSISVRFYARDGKKDPATGLPKLIFSEPFEFKLEQ
jgi:hypothetical protein